MARLASVLALLGVTACASTTAPLGSSAPEAIFIATGVYTGDPDQPTAEAVGVREGRVVFVGDAAAARAQANADTQITEIDGYLYPGFVDGHAHLFGIGEREVTLNLEGTASLDELVTHIEAVAYGEPADAVLVGRGWIETHWPEARFPTRDDLDAVAPTPAIILARADGHALVANSAALNRAGVTDATPDPAGGRIERDASGRATGVLIDAAMALLAPLIERPSGEARDAILLKGAEVYAAYGWTGLHSMSVDPGDALRLEELAKAGRLPIRVVNALTPTESNDIFTTGLRSAADGRVITRGVKIYIDGALGSRGAALDAPYTDQPDTSGLLMMDAEQAATLFDAALRAGVQMNVHAIGDRGNRLLLDWIAASYARVPEVERAIAAPRWRNEHAQILHPEDIARFSELGVIASMQPSHAIGDLHFAPSRLGDERLDGAYAWRSLLDAGAIVVGGSDAPVERGDPLIEFYAAVARTDLSGFQGPDWRAAEAVTRFQALAMFTTAPAYASFQEAELGVIALGMRADFTGFSGDIMTVPAAEIPTLQAILTVVGGEVVYAVP